MIRGECRCLLRGNTDATVGDKWNYSNLFFTYCTLGRNPSCLLPHTPSIFLYFTRVFNEKWVQGGTLSLSPKRSIVHIRLMDYLHHSAGKHLWQFQLRDFLNPSCHFFFFFATALSPSNTHFWASPAFCIVLATVCVWMCAEFRFVRRHGWSCQWSSPNSSVQPHSDSHFSSPRQRFLLLSLWFRGLVDRGCALLTRQLHRLRQTVNSALPSRAPPPLTIHRGIKGEEGNDVKRQTGSWTPYYLGSVWRTFLKCSARSVLTAVYSWHHPITTLTLQWSRIAEFSAWGPIENLHSETFSVVWVQRDLLAWACKGITFKKVFL